MNILLTAASKTESDSGLSLLILRITIATVFMAHGSQKLFSWFGGYGLEGTGQWMESIGLAPGYLMALLAGSGEFFGGLLLLFGLLTRASSLVLAITMFVAIFSVHFANGFFMSANGYEFAFVLLGASVALMFSGAGRYSLDALLLNK
ncbi:MAG: putative oxidoreductase [Cellvibrionaceae bacterium]|jgi:putative oxidoreductase